MQSIGVVVEVAAGLYSSTMAKENVTSDKMGALIRRRRKELGFSQEQLAEKVGVSYQQIQRYENGSTILSVINLQRIANAIGIEVTQFFDNALALEVMSEPDIGHTTSDEKTLLKHFKQIERAPDRQAVILIARRLAAKK